MLQSVLDKYSDVLKMNWVAIPLKGYKAKLTVNLSPSHSIVDQVPYALRDAVDTELMESRVIESIATPQQLGHTIGSSSKEEWRSSIV